MVFSKHNNTIYSTEKDKKGGLIGEQKQLINRRIDTAKKIIQELAEIPTHRIGYEQRIQIRKKTKKIDPSYIKPYQIQAKRVNGNIIQEYLRVVQQTPKVPENDPQTLWELMDYAKKSLNQETLDVTTCRKVRLIVEKTYNNLQKSNAYKDMLIKYERILTETRNMKVD